MKDLYIDIETYSSVDLKSCGAYKYFESSDFEILLIAYAIDSNPVQIIDCTKEGLPDFFIDLLKNPKIKKHAHNVSFERNAFKQFGFDIPIQEWYCSVVKASYCGLPFSLDLISEVLELGEKGKLESGKSLIQYFSVPCKPTNLNGNRKRNLPHHDLEKWEQFKEYCKRDVEAEREIVNSLKDFKTPEFERKCWILDQKINDRGVKVDIEFAKTAFELDNSFREEIIQKAQELTGLDNPNSPTQLIKWLNNATGEEEIETLRKEDVVNLISKYKNSETVSEVLQCREALSKTSTKKYLAMINCACEDNRARGLFQYYGASRTGRWAGRLIQLQNLPQNHMRDLEQARKTIKEHDLDYAKMMYGNISNVLSELIRTAFIPEEGNVFVVSDFSAIEARVLAWIANEQWRLKVFETHGKIYEASASAMFNVPIESVTKGSDLRQKGKTAELALGYQGGAMAMAKMGGEKMGLSETEMNTIVKKWRKANPSIVKFWEDVESYFKQTVKSKKSYTYNNMTFRNEFGHVTIELPSGRKLFYRNARIGLNRFGKESIVFDGMDQVIKKWGPIETYGGKITENIVQAISRDILAHSMMRLEEEGNDTSMHIHDEVVIEVLESDSDSKLIDICKIMSEDIEWAPGLPLKAEGYITEFYKKD